MVADEIEWKEEVRSKKGRSDHKFDHRIIKGASEIRFASCIPGNNMVIALGELYAPSIRLEWGGNDASKITCNGAHKAYGVLTDNQWAFWSRVLEVTFTLVVQVMFKDIMCNSGYNLPELATGGMWQRWVAAGHSLISTGQLHQERFASALAKGRKVHTVGSAEHSAMLQLAVQHVKDLTSEIGTRFGTIYNRPEMWIPGMLTKEIRAAREAAQDIVNLWAFDKESCHPAITRVMLKHKKAVEQFANGGLLDATLHADLCQYDQRCHSLRVESTFSVLTYLAKKASHVGLQRLSLVARAKMNDTVLEEEDWRLHLADARKMNRPDSALKAVYKKPKLESRWNEKFPAPALVTRAPTEAYDVFLTADQDAKCEKKLKSRKANPKMGLIVGCDNSKSFIRSGEAEKMADHGEDCDKPRELENAAMEIEEEECSNGGGSIVGGTDAEEQELIVALEEQVEEGELIVLETLEVCGICDEDQHLSEMRRYAGKLMCQRCARAGERMACGGSFSSDDDDGSNTSDSDGESGADGEPDCGAAKEPQVMQPSVEHVPLPNNGITVSWFISQAEGFRSGTAGTIVTSTVGAGTYRDFDKKRSGRLQKECITVTKYECVEIGTPSGWMYVMIGDFVELDVSTESGIRGVQIAEVTSACAMQCTCLKHSRCGCRSLLCSRQLVVTIALSTHGCITTNKSRTSCRGTIYRLISIVSES